MTSGDNPSIENILKSDRTVVRFAVLQGFPGRYDNRGKLGFLGCAKRPTVLKLVALPQTGSR
ncbi:hypothetical protein PpBr36_03358 [Pyricularia pennisetigena]|uniref:hypothetical protein n=1 Tax=Pyricularia pennisetigena TaxID=1578925 RepID=UPI00114EC393|nr:hypothetical protein PpBr36_03358 [Pyricularia pennisetigena]TLS31594.1 hypothetical protein PpBr36_03358 [Pyricularia pennisetigena]